MIERVDVKYSPIVNHQLNDFSQLINQKIEEINRIGKYLIVLTTDHAMIIHLRMEGKFYIRNTHTFEKHDHVIFHLDDQTILTYHDVRKFGRIYLRDKHHYKHQAPINQIASEPWDLDAHLFWQKLRSTQRAIKSVLLDQTIIAGLGNIYVDETLFLSGIHPMKRANTLTKKQAETILKHAQNVLSEAINMGGTTIRTFHSNMGIDGLFQNKLMVHTKKGLPCPKCHETIIKMKVGGRGTYVCTSCQKK